MYPGYEEDLRLVQVVPSPRQMRHQAMEFYGFIHFSINTFTGREWGLGNESPALFSPKALDAGQWVQAAKEGGMAGLVLTCKHHDGFCLWPSAYTGHSVRHSPFRGGKGDLVQELAQACQSQGLKFGVYLSPWDRNHPAYGQGKAYDDYYVNQLTELLTQYGEISTLWLDGACGEGPNGKKQVYDWERYYQVVRRLQPGAAIFGCGPDVRWCGNEAGDVRPSEWSVVPAQLADADKVLEASQQEEGAAFREKLLDPRDMDLGSREFLKDKKDLAWYPAEVDVSIRPGWFYHQEEDLKVRSFENLKDIYLKSVGGNCTLLLNLPPDRNGLIHPKDQESLSKLGRFIRQAFQENLACQAKVSTLPARDVGQRDFHSFLEKGEEAYFRNSDGCPSFEASFAWSQPQALHYLVVQEAIAFSQRVEAFKVQFQDGGGQWQDLASATTIGYKKILDLGGIRTRGLKLMVTDARVAPVVAFIGIY